MANSISIEGTPYQMRRQTYGAMLAQQDALDDMHDAQDRLDAVNQRMDHAGRRLAALSDTEGELDAAAEHDLLELRKTLRRDAAKVMREVVTAQLRLIHHRLVDAPPPERLMDMLTPEQARQILDETDEVPPSPSGQDGESS